MTSILNHDSLTSSRIFHDMNSTIGWHGRTSQLILKIKMLLFEGIIIILKSFYWLYKDRLWTSSTLESIQLQLLPISISFNEKNWKVILLQFDGLQIIRFWHYMVFCLKNHKIKRLQQCSSETVHIWPYVSKAKMCLKGCSLLWKLSRNSWKL